MKVPRRTLEIPLIFPISIESEVFGSSELSIDKLRLIQTKLGPIFRALIRLNDVSETYGFLSRFLLCQLELNRSKHRNVPFCFTTNQSAKQNRFRAI